MSGTESTESAQVKLMHEWGHGFDSRDISLVEKHLHKDYRHISLPRSLGMPESTREEYLEHMGKIMSFWEENQSTVHWIIESPGKVVAHVTSKVKTKFGIEATRESIYTAQIVTDDDGSLKIKQIEDFTDSKAHLEFAKEVMAAMPGNK